MQQLDNATMHNREVETQILAAMLYDNSCIKPVLGIIKPSDFFFEDSKFIAKACINLARKSQPADPITIYAELERGGKVDAIGGKTRIVEIFAAYHTSANVIYHALELKRLSENRKVMGFAREIVSGNEPPTVQNLHDKSKTLADESATLHDTDTALNHYDNFIENLHNVQPRISTGFSTIDKKIGGLSVPSVAVIGAYSSTGKTAFSLNIAAHQDAPVVFFSLEMSAGKIIERLSAAELEINYGKIQNRNLDHLEFQEISSLAQRLKAKKFHIFDNVRYIEQQESIVSSIKPKLVVIDYLQLARTHYRAESKRLEIDYMSQFYHAMSKQNDCVIILLSQLSRPAKGLKIHSPTMSDLKESGGIENDADYAGILHRPYVLNKNSTDVREEDGYLLLDKNRYGGTGKIDLHFAGKYQRFSEVDILDKKYAPRWRMNDNEWNGLSG